MIVGLGALTVGGGAVFGSGAFSTTEAQRTVEVNVIDNTDLASEFLDILFHAGNPNYGSVGANDNEETNPANIYPDSDDATNNYDGDNFSVSDEYVSLIANDVTLIFGTTDNELPPNATINYQNLFAVVNDNNDGDNTDFEVEFEVVDTEATFEFEEESPYKTTVDNDAHEEISLDLTTAAEESGTLEITINEA